jgi:hypothetical protein
MHTPGPWTIRDHPTETTQILGNGDALRVADVWCTDLPGGMDNARLIAQAPALVEALRDMICKPCETTDGTPHPWCDRARAILRAVEG